VDVIGWRDFPDRLAGKLVLFGQCASGGNWVGKRTELNPQAFMDAWLEHRLVSTPIKALFVPHRISLGKWEETSRKAGVTFDRCRLSYWAHQEKPLPKGSEFVAWCQTVLPAV